MHARATGLLLGALADAVLGDPRRGHPVAAFGSLAARLERRYWSDTRVAGTAYAAGLVGGAVVLGAATEALTASRRGGPHDGPVRTATTGDVAVTAVTAVATWAVLGGTSLAREGASLAGELEAGDLAAARRRLPSLCGRDPAALDGPGLARAGLESVAENTSDAVVAPLVWGALAGVPGLLGYRAVNTLDAMVGHRSARHERFGWAAARADDVANVLPARLTALLVGVVSGRPGSVLRAWRRDAGGHPSPNAGPVEAAFAGALGRRLGGLTVYPYGASERPLLGAGPVPEVADLARAVRLSRLVAASSLMLAVLVAAVLERR